MSNKEMFEEIEEEITEMRQLPYSITVEKIEGDIIWSHNQWGNSIKYRRTDRGYEIVDEE